MKNWGKKILEKVDQVLDQLSENIAKKNKLQPQPVRVRNRN